MIQYLPYAILNRSPILYCVKCNSFVYLSSLKKDERVNHNLCTVLTFLFSQNSPRLLCPKDRMLDTDAIYSVVDDAEQFIYIAVMDYLPIINVTNETRLVNATELYFYIAVI